MVQFSYIFANKFDKCIWKLIIFTRHMCYYMQVK